MRNHKMKGFLFFLTIVIIYTILKLYVASTPSPNDDQIPDQFVDKAIIFAISGAEDFSS